MPKAKKLPSGSYRVQVFSHKDSKGKKHYESFTAPTKKEAELLASEWANSNDRKKHSQLTVSEAISGYIAAKRGVLSPSTIRGYERMYRNNYGPLLSKSIKKLTTEELQIFVSDLAGSMSSKSVSNIYGLLSSSLSFYMPNKVFRVTLPQRIRKKTTAPSNEDIQALFNAATPEMKKCIALAAFGSLRRGEIAALTFSDLQDGVLSVTKDIIEDKDNKWILKPIPKSQASIREVHLPDKVMELLGSGAPDERIVKYASPSSISKCFIVLRNKIGVSIRFHDLRHYFCSIGAVLQIPSNYLEDFGGWRRGSSVMKEVYQNSIIPISEAYSRKMRKYFDDVMSGEEG